MATTATRETGLRIALYLDRVNRTREHVVRLGSARTLCGRPMRPEWIGTWVLDEVPAAHDPVARLWCALCLATARRAPGVRLIPCPPPVTPW